MDPEQDDGWFRKLEQKLEHKLVHKMDSEQADGWSQHLDVVRNKWTSHSKAVSVRSDKRHKSRLESTRQRAGQWFRQGNQQREDADHWDTEARVQYSTAGVQTFNGWNLTVELEAPNDATSMSQEVMDIMMTEKGLEQTEKTEHMRRLPHTIKQMLTGRKDMSSLQLFGWQGTDL